ncbi:MAG: hypothetical protein OHK0013_11350 [Sandaracinaceae bacterium]
MSWARATLLRGASSGSIWQVDENYPQARVTVGSAPNAGWVVTGPGIALFHVELYWDGNALYVADPQGVGDVRLNGTPVREWVQVQGRGQLVFGHAIMDLETSVAEPTSMTRDPGAAPRISAPLLGEATRVATTGDLENERTRMAASPLDDATIARSVPPPTPASPPRPSVRPPPPPSPGAAAPAPLPPAPLAPAAPPPPPASVRPPAMERPRLGGQGGGFRPEAKTLVGESLEPLAQEATRMVESPLSGGPAAPSVGFGTPASPGFGTPASPGFGTPASPGFGTSASPGFGASASPGFGAPGGLGTPGGFGAPAAVSGALGGFGAPAGGAMPATSPGMVSPPAAAGASAFSPPPPGTGGFAPPPTYQATQQLNAQSQTGNKVPTRTWLMLALFLAVVLAWLAMPTPEEEAASSRPPAVATPPVLPPGTDAGVDAGRPAYRNPSTFTPVLTAEPAPDGGLGRTPDSVAAQLVLEGHFEDALVQYEALHQARPERPEYGVMVEVLRRQLMSRCLNGQRWDGTPCIAP